MLSYKDCCFTTWGWFAVFLVWSIYASCTSWYKSNIGQAMCQCNWHLSAWFGIWEPVQPGSRCLASSFIFHLKFLFMIVVLFETDSCLAFSYWMRCSFFDQVRNVSLTSISEIAWNSKGSFQGRNVSICQLVQL